MGVFNLILPLLVGMIMGFILCRIWQKRKGSTNKNIKQSGGGGYHPPDNGAQGLQSTQNYNG